MTATAVSAPPTLPVARVARAGVPALVCLLGIAGCIAVLHGVHALREPIVQFGYGGAEFIEYAALEEVARNLPSGGAINQAIEFPRTLAGSDRSYPPLVHLAAAAGTSWAGRDFSAVALFNLLWLAAAVLATGSLAARLSPASDGGPDRRAAFRLGVLAALLTPALYATARRYYYDLPVTALVGAATAASWNAHRSTRSALASGAFGGLALLCKWQAAMFMVVPAALAVVRSVQPGRSPPFVRAARLLLAASLCLALVAPLLARSETVASLSHRAAVAAGVQVPERVVRPRIGSFEAALASDGLGLGSGSPAGARPPADRARAYADWVACSSLGRPLLAALLPGWVLLAARPRRLLVAFALVAGPWAILASRVGILDPRFVLPSLPVLLAASAAGWATSPRLCRVAAPLAISLAGLVQVAVVEGVAPPAWDPRPPPEGRGWNRVGEAKPSDPTPYVRALDAACLAATGLHPRARVALDDRLLGHAGWSWAMRRPCREELPMVVHRADETPPAEVARLLERNGPAVLIAAEPSGDPGWTEVGRVAMTAGTYPSAHILVSRPPGPRAPPPATGTRL